jgi:hypothetical protein
MNMGFWLIGAVALGFAIVIPAISTLFWDWYDNKKRQKSV